MRVRLSALLIVLLASAPAPAAAQPTPLEKQIANGIFLVAKPSLRDANFRETVVLVTQPEKGGPFGVIINRALPHRLSDAFPDHPRLKTRPETVLFGGPVAPRGLVFLVRGAKPDPRARAVLTDVFITTDADVVDALLKRPEPTRGLRVYAGYAGWRLGQLQGEIDRGDWFVLPADADTIFSQDLKAIWPALVKRASLQQTRAVPPRRACSGA